jgi:hypothetical protein
LTEQIIIMYHWVKICETITIMHLNVVIVINDWGVHAWGGYSLYVL